MSHRPAADDRTWRDHPGSVAPLVLVIGGFLTSPPLYWHLRRRLLRRGVAGVHIAPIWTADWLLVVARGHGAVATRAGRALLRAGDLSAASPRSLGAPLLVIGHSAGGVMARVLTSPKPFDDRAMNGSGRIGAIVTLGSPHRMTAERMRHRAGAVSDFAERVVPGAYFAPTTGYLSVMSRHVVGDPAGDRRQRAAQRRYQLVHRPGEAGGIVAEAPIEGDGLVPITAARLPGAREIILPDAIHGQLAGEPWYGTDEMLDRWWPSAVDVWREALYARLASRGSGAGRAS